MRPQFFPWLFDDKDAWEKAFADPRYSYDLPIENFMSIYQVERKVDNNSAGQISMPMFSMPVMPLPTMAPAPVQPFTMSAPISSGPAPFVAAAPAAAPVEAPKEDGILSQDEIDALLSGL
jgi:hypothetical protein